MQHGRVMRTGQQQVFKTAQRMGPRHVDQVMAYEGPHRALANIDIEVVKPELGHACQQHVFQLRLTASLQPPGVGLLDHGAVEVLRLSRDRKIQSLVRSLAVCVDGVRRFYIGRLEARTGLAFPLYAIKNPGQ